MSDVQVTEEGQITVFTINRPDKLNAISKAVAEDLQNAFAEFDASDQRVAIITGAGGHFSSGADVTDMPELWRCVPTVGIQTKKPVIAAVDGWCVGGGMLLAVLADLCVVSDRAKFSYPEGKIGTTGGIIAALAARIPHKMAMEILLLGRVADAQRAFQMGLVNEVVPPEDLLPAALRMAEELTRMAPMVLSTLKSHVNDEMLTRAPMEKAALALAQINRVRGSEDLQEGLAAFREKRAPVFRNR